jgi:adenylyl-sulfate kinase
MDRTQGFTLWFTGMSGAGKSTLAAAVRDLLVAAGHRVEVLDGDQVRQHLSEGLGFSKADRDTNVRRVGLIARLLARNGVVAITAMISPYRDTRDEVRRSHEAPFIEVFVDCSLEELVRRDSKGLYAKALRGEIEHFTGVSDPYEPPLTPDLHLHTDAEGVEDSVMEIIAVLRERQLVADDADRLLAPAFR